MDVPHVIIRLTMNSVRTVENRKENDVLSRRQNHRSVNATSLIAPSNVDCSANGYAAEGPQLSVADRKFVGIERRSFINDSVDQHALDPLNCDYCHSTHISCVLCSVLYCTYAYTIYSSQHAAIRVV